MPIYEYCCKECKHVFEEWQKDFTDREMPCPVCGASAKRMISSTAFILKGSGWYATDYAGKSRTAGDNGKGNGNGGKPDSKKSDSDSSVTTSDKTAASESKSSTSNEPS